MIKRTIYLQHPSYLKVKHKQLEVYVPETGELKGSVPIEDIGVIIFDNPRITLTYSVIRLLNENNAAVIFCDLSHMPISMLLPLDSNTIFRERVEGQMNMSESLKKRLWKRIVIQKILNQMAVLNKFGKDYKRLEYLAKSVKLDDSGNAEGIAAAYYWKELFGKDFIRDRYGEIPNPQLNYGYAIIRSIVGRALSCSGLIPVIGIHHKSRYNSYCLADDMMESLRPIIDVATYIMWERGSIEEDKVTQEQRLEYLKIIAGDVTIKEHKSPLIVSASVMVSSLVDCIENNDDSLLKLPNCEL